MSSWQRLPHLASSSHIEEKYGGISSSGTKWKLTMRWLRRRRLFIVGLVAIIALYYVVKLRKQAKITPRVEETMEVSKTGLAIQGDHFILDNRPFLILSGSVHYFRVPRAYWKDRLAKLKAAGLNTVDTYVAWNLHEHKPGAFDFSGELDIVEFLTIARDLGLYVLLRPGPYICAEWDWGGLPAWLLSDPNMRIRTTYDGFTKPVKEYLKQLFSRVAAFQYTKTKGGPIIAVQIENEYGSYGEDKAYLNWLKDTLKEVGVVEFLFTSDGPTLLQKGYTPGIYATVNFNDKTGESLDMLAQFQPNQPLMTAEFWPGWFDHWRRKGHHMMLPEDLVARLEPIFKRRASLNLYMFHGGTNFGFMNGANLDFGDQIRGNMLMRLLGRIVAYLSPPAQYAKYLPTVTSYDYDAPLNEFGGRSRKWDQLRGLITKYFPKSVTVEDPWKDWRPPTFSYGGGRAAAHSSLTLTDAMDVGALPALPIELQRPVFVEQVQAEGADGLYHGFVAYRANLPAAGKLILDGVLADRMLVLVDGHTVDTIQFDLAYQPFRKEIQLPPQQTKEGSPRDLILLVENMGRANYVKFPHKLDGMFKGFNGTVKLVGADQAVLLNRWKVYGVRFKTPADLGKMASIATEGSKWKSIPPSETKNSHKQTQPTFYKLEFPVKEFADDTFVNMKDWTKGVVYANGVNLGRYWNEGPTKTLYLPGPWLKKDAQNELIVFELHQQATQVILQGEPDLGEPCIMPCNS